MSRFYEAMKRALEQQSEPDRAAVEGHRDESKGVGGPQTVPFDLEAVTPVRRDPLAELDDLAAHRAPSPPVLEPAPEPIPLRPVESAATRPRRALHPSYERLIQRVLAFRGGRRHCVLLVASAVPGEGASTIARNLAVALGGSSPGSVVLVDANLRAPSVHSEFATGGEVGLANVLCGDTPLSSAMVEIDHLGITALPGGQSDASPPHLVTVSAMQGVVTALQSKFDWVILDGPPLTTSPEASNLAVVADGAILVLRAEKTRWEVAETAMKVLTEAGAALLGGVLNGRRYHIPEFIYKRL